MEKEVRIRIDEAACVGCGACVADCLNKALAVENGKARVRKACFMCGHCVAVCPKNAVHMAGADESELSACAPGEIIAPYDTVMRMLKLRRSIRQFEKRHLSRDEIDAIISAGRYSPTGSNAQNVSYKVFRDGMEELNRFSMERFRAYQSPEAFSRLFPPPMSPDRVDFSNDDFLFKGADTVILTVCQSAVNAAIASANMELAANALGIGMLYVGFFVRLTEKDAPLREYLHLSDDETVVTALAFGFPAVRYFRSAPRLPAKVEYR